MGTEDLPSPETPSPQTLLHQSPPSGSRGRKAPFRFMLILLLAAGVAVALWLRGRDPLRIDRRAAIVEVLPAESLQASPAASDLVNRLINKHVVLLQARALITQVLQNPETIKRERWMSDKKKDPVETLLAAVHVWPIPDSNMIALRVDSGGDDSASLAEAIVNQHLENQRQISQNALLERSVILNNLKQRYQFRKDELGRDLREKAARLSIDGMGLPGGISPKEVELVDLLYLRGEVERKMLDAKDPEVKDTLKGQMKNASERIDALQADLGDLTNAINLYQALKDDERVTREQLNKINEELELIRQQANELAAEVRWVRHPDR